MANKYLQFADDNRAEKAQDPARRSGPTNAAANKYLALQNPEPVEAEPTMGRGEDDAWYEKAGRFGLDTLRNFNDTLTFGLYNKGLEATGIDTQADEKLAEADANNPWAGVVGDTLGYVLPGMGVGSAVAKAAPALARNTIPSLIGREAATNGILSATDDVVRTGELDPLGIGIDTLIGGASAGLLAGAGRVISPSARVRAMGNDLDEFDRIMAMSKMAEGESVGIPLNVPEAVAAGAPGKSTALLSGLDNAANTDRGADVLNRFNAARQPAITEAGERMVSDLGGGLDPQVIQKNAQTTLTSRGDLVRKSAQPYYDVADQASIPAGNVPRSAATKEAAQLVAKNAPKMEDLAKRTGGQVTPSSVAFLDATKKQLNTQAKQVADTDSYLASIYNDDAKALTDAIDPLVPEYPIARDITEKGMLANEALEAGPLGNVARNPTTSGQGDALFGVDTDVDAIAAKRATRFLGPDTTLGILANRVDAGVTNNPLDFGSKVLPNKHSRAVAQEALGPGDHFATLDAAANVRTPRVLPEEKGRGGLFDRVWDSVRAVGKGRVTEKLMDPKTLEILGKTGPVQRGLTLGSTGIVQTADFGGQVSGKTRKLNRSR